MALVTAFQACSMHLLTILAATEKLTFIYIRRMYRHIRRVCDSAAH